MQVVLAVIDELFQFASRALFGISPVLHNKVRSDIRAVAEPTVNPLPFTPSLPGVVLESEESFVTGEQYFVGSLDVYLHTDPVISFDTATLKIPYGSRVQLIKFGGRWAQVRYKAQEGWVLKDVLRDQLKDVFPQFVSGDVYDAYSSETIKLRAYIDDEYGCARASLPLCGVEFVTYALLRKKRVIPWSDDRPRLPGTWQRKLRGRTGVHIGVTPKTESIMEYIVDDIGYVGYIEAVFPDDSIMVHAVGLTQDGTYTDEILTKEQWKELRPVFIDVS